MSKLTITPVTTARQRRAFVRFPWRVYRGAQPDPLWVPPLLAERDVYFDPARGPYYRHATVQLFLAQRGGAIVGTIAAHVNHLHNETYGERAGCWGFFEVLDDPDAAAALLASACDWCAQQGCTLIRGPFNFSINDECGLLIEGFNSPPVALMTYNPPRYIDYVEKAWFTKAMDLYAWIINRDDPEAGVRLPKVRNIAARTRAALGLTLRTVDMGRFEDELRAAWGVYNHAWAENWGAVPMTWEEFKHLGEAFKPFLNPELLFMAEIAGRPVGMLIAIPDLNMPLRHMNGRLWPLGWLRFLWERRRIDTMRVILMGVLPEYRRRGIDAVFYEQIWDAAAANGYQRAEMSWILESNRVMNSAIAMLGGRRYKTYRIYERNL